MIEIGKVISFSKADSAAMVEHVCLVTDMPSSPLNNNIITTNKCMTVFKQPSPEGVLSMACVPNFGIATNTDKTTGDKTEIRIDLGNFDFVNECLDETTINKLDDVNSPLIVDRSVINQMSPENNQGLHLV